MTTALAQYAKLEAIASYHDGTSRPPVEVVLSFGARTLILLGLDDQVVGHWPLASLRALGERGERPVRLVPDLQSRESVSLEEPEMVGAILSVCPKLYARRAPRQSRRRFPWIAATLLVVLLSGLILVPRIADRLVGFVPEDRDRTLGEAIAARLAAGPWPDGSPVPRVCAEREGRAALGAIIARLNAAGAGLRRIRVIERTEAQIVLLPGGQILISSGAVLAARSPDEAAALIAHAAGHLRYRDPTRAILRDAGWSGILALFFGNIFGGLEAGRAAGVVLGRGHLAEEEDAADGEAYRILAAAGLPTRPLVSVLARVGGAHAGSTGRSTAAAAADRVGVGPFKPVLEDRAWIALGNICDRQVPMRPPGRE